MAGPLKTLFQTLQSSQYLNGVSVVYGDEEINMQRYQLPLIVMVPKGGTYSAPGYAANIDPGTELLWEVSEVVELWLYNCSPNKNEQAAIDHADAVESLRTLVLSALQDQRAQYADINNVSYGLAFVVTAGRWEVSTNPVSRFNRSYVLSVEIKIPIVMAPPPEATITSTQLNQTFVDKPAT